MTALLLPGSLVSPEWLMENLEHKDLVIFDASWHMPAAARDGLVEWRDRHIKHARFFDFDRRICRPNSSLPHMMPDAALFDREMRALGLNQDSVVVVYDSLGIVTSPRAWWMLRAMGCEKCAVLDGGLPAWIDKGFAVTDEVKERSEGNFVSRALDNFFTDADEVLTAIKEQSASILDARSSERFRGEVDEPRTGLRRGHMPGATNLPFTDLFVNGRMKPGAELELIYSEKISPQNRTILTCGSGVTACVIALGAHLAGYHDLSVYDGSWCEWGQPGDLPVELD